MKYALYLLCICVSNVFAHYFYLETHPSGIKGQSHSVNIFFGEYGHGLIEKPGGETFEKMKQFTVWVVLPSGKKEQLQPTKHKTHYSASFLPKEEGVYSVHLNNDNIDVIDYTKYDFGIFKTHYHSVAKVHVGNTHGKTATENSLGLDLVDVSDQAPSLNGKVTLQLLHKGIPLSDHEVKVFISDLWEKPLKTDEKGYVTFSLPWKTTYVVEATRKEQTPGTFREKPYQFIWQATTHTINL
mgnify:FL=1